MCGCTLLLIIPYALSNIHMVFCRVQQDRREQARQDLKGLEETVVSFWNFSPKRDFMTNDLILIINHIFILQ